MTTWSTCSGSTLERSSAAVMARPPSSVASREASAPPILPIGVRAVPRITVLGIGTHRYWADANASAHHRPPRPRHARRHDRRRRVRGQGRRPRPRRAARSQALLDAGEARRSFKHLARHARTTGKRWMLVGLGRPRRVRRRARAGRRGRRRRPRDASSARGRCAGRSPTTSTTTVVGGLVEGTLLAAYRFDRYKSDAGRRAPAARGAGRSAPTTTSPRRCARRGRRRGGQRRARPAEHARPTSMTPTALAERARRSRARRRHAVEGRDADRGPRDGRVRRGGAGDLRGARADHAALRAGRRAAGPHLGFVGKAVTFDSGGISIKPGGRDGGDEVRHVAAAPRSSRRSGRSPGSGCPVRVTGVVGATENMPSGARCSPATS